MSEGTRSGKCYTVQARIKTYGPKAIGDQLFGDKWQTINFERSPIGVPGDAFTRGLDGNYLTYAQAEALRWWFAAEARFTVGLQTRLVEHSFVIRTTVSKERTLAKVGDHLYRPKPPKPKPAPDAPLATPEDKETK